MVRGKLVISQFPEMEEGRESPGAKAIHLLAEAIRGDDILAINTIIEGDMHGEQLCSSWLEDPIQANNLEIAKCLLQHGLDPNRVHRDLLVEYTSLEMLKLFVEYGLDLSIIGHEILCWNLKERELVDWIVTQGVDLNKTTRYKLHHRPGYAANLDPNHRGERDLTCECLNRAATIGDVELFELLVSHGANPHRSIALHKATHCRDPLLTTKMIAHLIDTYHFDVMGSGRCNGLRWFLQCLHVDGPMDTATPLQSALDHSNVAALEAFLWYAANPNDILEGALLAENMEILKLLLEYGADAERAMSFAVQLQNQEAIVLCSGYLN